MANGVATALKLEPADGAIQVSWDVTATTGIGYFRACWRVPGGQWAYSVPLSAATRAYSIATAVKLQVEVQTFDYAAGIQGEAAPLPSPSSSVIIGVNDAFGWGTPTAQALLKAGIKSARIGGGPGPNNAMNAKAAGFSPDLAIVGNTPDQTPLTQIDTASWLAATVAEVKECVANGVTLCEVINEAYLKGGTVGANAVRYGELVTALHAELVALRIRSQVKLLANAFGRTWMTDLATVPGIKTVIDGFTHHSYGRPGENQEGKNEWGPGCVAPLKAEAQKLGLPTGFYITEFGVLSPGSTGGHATLASTEQEKAEWITTVCKELITAGVLGIWIYETHDESATQKWGLFTNQGESRPALAAVAAVAAL
jgi:hypothetical protein